MLHWPARITCWVVRLAGRKCVTGCGASGNPNERPQKPRHRPARKRWGGGSPLSATTVNGGLGRVSGFYDSVIGKKVVMAVTGFILFGFILVHMLANLQIFLPPGAAGIPPLDAYAEHLRALPPLLWGSRVVLLASVILHILAAWQLTVLNKFGARKTNYSTYKPIASNYASRTMIWSGPIIFFYVIYHLLDFTIGTVNPNFEVGAAQRHRKLPASGRRHFLHHRQRLPGVSPLSRRVEHVSVARHLAPALHALAEKSFRGVRPIDWSGILLRAHRGAEWTDPVTV